MRLRICCKSLAVALGSEAARHCSINDRRWLWSSSVVIAVVFGESVGGKPFRLAVRNIEPGGAEHGERGVFTSIIKPFERMAARINERPSQRLLGRDSRNRRFLYVCLQS